MAVESGSGQPPTHNGRKQATSVLFGPQGTLTVDGMLEVRRLITETPDLEFLSETISELPSLWSTVLDAWPDLVRVPAKKKLQELAQFFQGGSNLSLLEPTNNTILCPLTVITQIVDFWKLGHGDGETSVIESSMQDVQGFCLGFLTAVAISCAKDEAQYQLLAAKAVRLALCAGAVVDLNTLIATDGIDEASAIAVRWKSSSRLQDLEQIINLHPGVSASQRQCVYSTEKVLY